MQQTFEITGKFDSESSCNKLLYAPLDKPLTCREQQCYRFEYEGDEAAFLAFVNRVLVDPISQDLHTGGALLWPKAAFVLEYGMKGAALDLEKEMILNYYRAEHAPGFTITKLMMRKRVYVFGEGADPAPFVRDVVNPAIHTHEVLRG